MRFAGIPQQVNVAGGQCVGVQAHPGGGLVGVERMGADHAKVRAQLGAGQAAQQRHDQWIDPAHAQGAVQALVLLQGGFEAEHAFCAFALALGEALIYGFGLRCAGSEAGLGPGGSCAHQVFGVGRRRRASMPVHAAAHLGSFRLGFFQSLEGGDGIDVLACDGGADF